MTDDGLLLWQRIAKEKGQPTDVPPQRLPRGTTTSTAAGQAVARRGSRRAETIPPREGLVDGQPNTYILVLPRWDIAWEDKTRGRGRNKHYVLSKSGKRVRVRRVWDALKGNQRAGSWHARHKAVGKVIHAVVAAAHRVSLPEQAGHLAVRLVWAPGDRRRADEDNLVGLAKPCYDALARGRNDLPGLRLVPDDTPQWMTKPTPRIDPPPAEGLWLEVTVTP